MVDIIEVILYLLAFSLDVCNAVWSPVVCKIAIPSHQSTGAPNSDSERVVSGEGQFLDPIDAANAARNPHWLAFDGTIRA